MEVRIMLKNLKLECRNITRIFILDFIVACRTGHSHEYDIVEGPMADDTIFNYVQNFVDGKISREAFWSLAKFKHPTHQISFHTERALSALHFLKGSEVRDEE